MTDDDLTEKVNAMISEYVEHRERFKIPVSGDIYRLPAKQTNPGGYWDEQWIMDVWDDEFATQMIVLEQEPPPETVAAIFRQLKATWCRKDQGDTHTG